MVTNKKQAVTAKMIAALCGVSQGTVDRALNGRGEIKGATKERILKVAAEYGYQPNVSARRLAGGRSGLVGVVVFDLHNEYFSELIMYLEKCFDAVGMMPVVMFSNKDAALERTCIQKLYAMGVEGIILCSVCVCRDMDFVQELSALSIPIVTVGNRLGNLPHIGIDNRRAMYDLAMEKIGASYRRYVYFSPALSHVGENREAQDARYLGFLDAAKEKGITPETVSENTLKKEDITADTLVMASTDYYALRLIFAGVPVSQVTGFDHISLPEKCHIPLVTVDGASAEIATALADFFTNTEKRGKSVTVPHRLIL